LGGGRIEAEGVLIRAGALPLSSVIERSVAPDRVDDLGELRRRRRIPLFLLLAGGVMR
jgi:hypothetical protein